MAKVRGLSEQELELAYSGPAMAANRLFVTITPSGVRITFAEQTGPGKPAHFRTAVIMSIQDGIALRDVLSKTLKDAEAAIEKTTAAPAAQKSDG